MHTNICFYGLLQDSGKVCFMQIEDHSILLAPGSMHLSLYSEIHNQKGDCLDINVLTPEAYIASLLEKPKEQVLPVLYTYKELLENLNPNNVFYNSRNDYQFLKACYEFCGWIQLLDLQRFPETTQKDRDLKEILTLLSSAPLWQKEAADLQFTNASRIWILDSDYPEQTGVLLKKMIDQGARLLGQKASEQQLEYWSASNPRKEVEVIAREIIEKSIPAEDVFIALADYSNARVLHQVFNHQQIPHTFLHDPVPSKILRQFQAVFQYIVEPAPQRLQEVLRELFGRSASDLRQYLELFPQGSNLKHLVYEENPIISPSEFEKLQSLEAQSEPWLPELNRIRQWDYRSMEDIATLIQEQNPDPDEDDIRNFDSILSAYASAADRIHSNADLELFVRHLTNTHPSSTLKEMSGVLIGSPKEISSLRRYVFYMGADARHFPSLHMHEGIFDEDYLRHTDFPLLQTRLEEQKKALFERLKQPAHLYVLTPQSDYEGESIEASFEMNTWVGRFPEFQRMDDQSIYRVPDFSLSQKTSLEMFAPHQVFQAGVRSLQVFQDCPLRHMLRFGLRLKSSYGFFDDLRVRPEIISRVLFQGHLLLDKTPDQLSAEDVRWLIGQEMEFPRKVFVSSVPVLDVLQEEYAQKVWELLSVLQKINREWNLTMTSIDYDVQIQEIMDSLQVEITGSLTPASKAPVSLFDPGDIHNPQASPKATLALGLDLKPFENKASKISYGRGSRADVNPVTQEECEDSFITDFLKNAVVAQNLEDIHEGYAPVIQAKSPTYEQRQTDLKNAARSFLLSLSANCIAPEHRAGACNYCAYASICRNGARERDS